MNNLVTNDAFDNALKTFDNSAFANRLQSEFRLKPYHEKNRKKYLLSVIAGYLFNMLSLVTGGSLVYYFLLPFMPYQLAGALTIIALLILEGFKRESIGTTAKDYLQFGKFNILSIGLVLLLAVLSITGSYFGAKSVIAKNVVPYANIDTDTLPHIAALVTSIEVKQQQIEAARETKWNGTTTNESVKTIKELTAQISPLELELIEARKAAHQENSTAKRSHENTTITSADNFAYFSLCCEFLFLLCVWYGVLYRFTSFKQMTAINTVNGSNDVPETTDHNRPQADHKQPAKSADTIRSSDHNSPKAPNNDNTGNNDDSMITMLKQQRTKLKKQLATYRHRLENSKGNPETQRTAIETLKMKIENITSQITQAKSIAE